MSGLIRLDDVANVEATQHKAVSSARVIACNCSVPLSLDVQIARESAREARTKHAALHFEIGKQIASIHHAGVEFSFQIVRMRVDAANARRHDAPTRRMKIEELIGAKRTSQSKWGNL